MAKEPERHEQPAPKPERTTDKIYKEGSFPTRDRRGIGDSAPPDDPPPSAPSKVLKKIEKT